MIWAINQTQTKSNRERRSAGKLIFCSGIFFFFYRPKAEIAAAHKMNKKK